MFILYHLIGPKRMRIVKTNKAGSNRSRLSARNNFCYLGVHQDHYFANFGGHRKNAAVRSFSTEA